MKVAALAWRQARREFRAGELRTLSVALVIAVAALTAVAAFSQRVERGLQRSANELLGGDLVVVSRYGIDEAWRTEAIDRGLRAVQAVEFPTVAYRGERSMLVEVKAVDAGYPLRGALEVADTATAPAVRATGIPEPGSVWVDPRVLGQLAAQPGDVLELGDSRFTIQRVIRVEPDRSGVFDLAPRVLVRRDELAASGLLGVGARAQYRLFVAGAPGTVAAYEDWLEPRLENAFFQTLERSQQRISSALDRAGRFLSLAALSAVLLAGVALVIAARQFALRHYDTVAILRCLGARQAETLAMLVLELLVIALPAIAVGIALGYLAQLALVAAMGPLIPEALPAADAMPALAGLATGLVALLGFGLPPLYRLRRVPPARVLKRDTGPAGRDWSLYLVPAVVSVALIYLQAADARLGTLVTIGLAGTLAAVALLAGGVLYLLRRLGNAGSVGWRYGLANVGRRRAANLFQIAALALGTMMIFLLSVIQADLLSSWRQSLPENTPNYFLINIQPGQRAALAGGLERADMTTNGLFPMAVGKLTAVNGSAEAGSEAASRRWDRSVNLSWSAELPAANELVAGQWWDDPSVAQVSLVDTWAAERGVGLGDRITFSVGEREVEVEVTSLRAVDWDSFQVNFFILLSPGAGEGMPASYVGSVHVPAGGFDRLGTLLRDYPNVTVVDIGTILQRVRDIIDRVTLTVRVVFIFTVVAGVLVLLSALRAGLAERIYEGAVLRALGGSRAQLRQAVVAEFAVIGAMAGGLAAGAALAVGWLIAREAFQIAYHPSWGLLPLGLALGAAAIVTVGVLGSRRVLTTPPVVVLRG